MRQGCASELHDARVFDGRRIVTKGKNKIGGCPVDSSRKQDLQWGEARESDRKKLVT